MPTALPRLVLVLSMVAGLTAFPATSLAQSSSVPAEQAFSHAYNLYANQLYGQAAPAFHRFRTHHPAHPSLAEALYYEAESLLALERADAAVALFRQFQQQFPHHPLAFQARLALGQHFYTRGEYDRTLNALQSVLDDAP
ncbi:MAG: tetratricopeptide repeat protein, partial [Bacteroidetes bacterium]|nr:tetratricopeptide repeat protein [Bacteroidota bacterium]